MYLKILYDHENFFGGSNTILGRAEHTPAEISTPKFRQKRVFGPISGTFEVSGGYAPSRVRNWARVDPNF